MNSQLDIWIENHKDENLATCILDIRQLDSLKDHSEVYKLHDFLWIKQRQVAKQFEI